MVIENYKDTIRVKLTRFFITLICVLSIIILLIESQWFDFWPNSNIHIAIIIGFIFVIYFVFDYIRDYQYIYFNDEGPNIILRFYTLRMYQQVNKSIEIPKKSFYYYEIKKSFFGTKRMLTMMQQLEGKVYNYPPVNIGLLKKKDIDNIKLSLNKYIKKKQ